MAAPPRALPPRAALRTEGRPLLHFVAGLGFIRDDARGRIPGHLVDGRKLLAHQYHVLPSLHRRHHCAPWHSSKIPFYYCPTKSQTCRHLTLLVGRLCFRPILGTRQSLAVPRSTTAASAAQASDARYGRRQQKSRIQRTRGNGSTGFASSVGAVSVFWGKGGCFRRRRFHSAPPSWLPATLEGVRDGAYPSNVLEIPCTESHSPH